MDRINKVGVSGWCYDPLLPRVSGCRVMVVLLKHWVLCRVMVVVLKVILFPACLANHTLLHTKCIESIHRLAIGRYG